MAKEKEKFDKHKYNAEYTATHYVRRALRFKPDEDKDVLEKLDSQKSMSQYVRQLIRADIAKNGGNENE